MRMAIKEILTAPDPRLREVSKPVAEVDDALRALMDDMLETMYDAPGIGLAAIQIGVPKRVIVMDLAGKDEEPEPPPPCSERPLTELRFESPSPTVKVRRLSGESLPRDDTLPRPLIPGTYAGAAAWVNR